MIRKHKKSAITVFIALFLVSVIVFALDKYPNAKLSFTGMELVTNGSSTQGFVDISIKNIDTTGITFCIKYNKKYIELSKADDNKPIVNPGYMGDRKQYNVKHEYFIQNTDVFPVGVFLDSPTGFDFGYSPNVLGMADQEEGKDEGYLIMTFDPSEKFFANNPEINVPCIETVDVDGHGYLAMMSNKYGELKLGRISFNIVNPGEFSKLSQSQLNDVIQITPINEMIPGTGDIPNIDVDTGLALLFFNDMDDPKAQVRKDTYVSIDFNIKAELTDVKPRREEFTVTSYDIYNESNKENPKQDLLDYLNTYANMLTMYYTDTSEVPAPFEWTEECEVNGTSWDNFDWNPKGGEYTVTQTFSDKYEITVKVNVTPINLTGFTVDDESITYWAGASDFPKDVSELSQPGTAHPVLDTYIQNYALPDVPIDSYTLEGAGENKLPDDWGKVDATYKYLASIDVNSANFGENYPWLTVSDIPNVEFYRSVVLQKTDLPFELEVIDSEVNDDGELVVKVQYKERPDDFYDDESAEPETAEIEEGTEFRIMLPGGQVIDKNTLDEGKFTVVIEDGKATVTVSPDIDNDNEKLIAQIINLGSRAGTYYIAAKAPNAESFGAYVSFMPEPRNNYYLEADSATSDGSGNYVFDYSGSLSALFPIKETMQLSDLPTTMTLPVPSHKINTTYDGTDGSEQGALQTFTVTGWQSVDGSSPSQPGSVVTIKGTLANTDGYIYTNYGKVQNNKNRTVTIKYYVLENNGDEVIADIPDYTFSMRQEGYGYDELQTKSFTVRNIGIATDIYGLTAVIDATADGHEAFVITKDLCDFLGSGESVDFDITTLHGLRVLDKDIEQGYTDYVCNVRILSNNGVLKTFKVSFKVTLGRTYNITIIVDDDEKAFGSARTVTGTTTALSGDTVDIIAEAVEDCEFTGWELVSGGSADEEPDEPEETLSPEPEESPEATQEPENEEEEEPVVPDDSFFKPSAYDSEAWFTMPDGDVVIKAHFKETAASELKLEDLIVKNSANMEDQPLCNEEWQRTLFDPTERTYYVAVNTDVDQVLLWFKLFEGAENAEMTLTYEYASDFEEFIVEGPGEEEPEQTEEPKETEKPEGGDDEDDPKETENPEGEGEGEEDNPTETENPDDGNGGDDGGNTGGGGGDNTEDPTQPGEGDNPGEDAPKIKTLTVPKKDQADGYYKSEDIDLLLGHNVIQLTFKVEDPEKTDEEGNPEIVERGYTIHIYKKLPQSKLYTFAYGNSPYGLIMGDPYWDDEQKENSIKEFDANGNMFTTKDNTPSGAVQNVPYTEKAWEGSFNYDKDPTALFVINEKMPFGDPGFKSLMNSIGEQVSLSDVSKKVKVNVLISSESYQNGSTEDFYYVEPTTIQLEDTPEGITALVDKRIRPDCYKIIYSFVDFDGTVIEMEKAMIILSPLGDVNVSGMTDKTDASRILNRFSTDLTNSNNSSNFPAESSYKAGGNLFKYRVCDVNKDGNLNAIDANNIRAGEDYITQFYGNVSGESTHSDIVEGGGG